MSVNFSEYCSGTKNSLAAFVRSLRKELGSDVSSFCACNVDDVVISCKTYEEHLRHINFIFNKLTTAGFTINALKCKFCQPQMNILGHVIGPEAISAGPQRIAAILSYLICLVCIVASFKWSRV